MCAIGRGEAVQRKSHDSFSFTSILSGNLCLLRCRFVCARDLARRSCEARVRWPVFFASIVSMFICLFIIFIGVGTYQQRKNQGLVALYAVLVSEKTQAIGTTPEN